MLGSERLTERPDARPSDASVHDHGDGEGELSPARRPPPPRYAARPRRGRASTSRRPSSNFRSAGAPLFGRPAPRFLTDRHRRGRSARISPPAAEAQIVELAAALSRSLSGCTSPTGRVTTSPARWWPAGSSRRSPPGPSARSSTTSTSNRTGPDTGGRPGSTASSRTAPRRCSGAMPRPRRLARGEGGLGRVRRRDAQLPSPAPRADPPRPSPGRSSGRSSSTSGEGR